MTWTTDMLCLLYTTLGDEAKLCQGTQLSFLAAVVFKTILIPPLTICSRCLVDAQSLWASVAVASGFTEQVSRVTFTFSDLFFGMPL